ncbi:9605_t:CDS:2, partial [Funneliformis geosporum]
MTVYRIEISCLADLQKHNALKDEGEARRKNWELAQNLRAYAQSMVTRKQNRINTLSQEKIILQLIVRCKDGQITDGNQIGGLNTAGEFQDKAVAKIGRIGAGVATAGDEPVDNALVASNTGGGFPAVTIAPGIKLSQLLYLFRTSYTTVEYLKQMAVFGQLMQGNMTVEQFSANIKKI